MSSISLFRSSKDLYSKVKTTLHYFNSYMAASLSTDPAQTVEDVVFNRVDTKRVLTLNRPAALNSLSLNMIKKIYPKLQKYESPDAVVDLVVLKGFGDRAFCAGGDIVSITEAGKLKKAGKKDVTLIPDFFTEEYKLNYLIGTYEIPFIAIIDGITMGGGVGVSVHGLYRVATERTVFAMPETAIGFFPDVGGSFFMPRLKGQLGMFLALTGHRLVGRDVHYAGIATHFVHSSLIDKMENELIVMDPDKMNKDTIGLVLANYHSLSANFNKSDFSLEKYFQKINAIFAAKSMEDIWQKLEQDGSEWAVQQLETLQKMSPTSMKITHNELLLGANLSLKQCLQMEFRLANRFCEDHDFYEGVRAVLVDKDKKPKWKPATLAEVTKDTVDHYFSPLPDAEELRLVD